MYDNFTNLVAFLAVELRLASSTSNFKMGLHAKLVHSMKLKKVFSLPSNKNLSFN